jgi:hypothetical protein
MDVQAYALCQDHMFKRSSEGIAMVHSGHPTLVISYSCDSGLKPRLSILQDQCTYSDDINYEEVGSYYPSTLNSEMNTVILSFVTLLTM